MVSSQSANVNPFHPALPKEFNDILLKLWRAHQHTEAFNSAIHAHWKTPENYEGAPDRDRQGRHIYRVVRVTPPPPEIGILIGEAAHQMRSSLDHLMWLLARPKTRKEEGKVQFPIVSKGTRWKDTGYMMPGAPRGVRALVKRLQPYHSRKWPQTALLGQLQAISNWDKHRTLTTTAAAISVTQSVITITGRAELRNVEHLTPVLKAGAILARFEVGDFDHGTEVKMKPETTVIPQFDERMPKEIRGRPPYDILFNCRVFIYTDILPLFARFF